MSLDPLYIKTGVPQGRSGDWVVERFIVRHDEDYDPARDARPDCAKRRPGTYTALKRGSEVFMTDLYDEWWTQRIAIREARRCGGNILITGLGLGMIVESIFADPRDHSHSVTVVEFSSDVIRLVGPHLKSRYGDRLHIVHADAFSWTPPAGYRFSVGWHDIWPNPVGPVVAKEMETLERLYSDCCDWQGCWPRDFAAVFDDENQAPPIHSQPAA